MRKNLMVLCELFVKNVGKNWRRIIQRRDKTVTEFNWEQLKKDYNFWTSQKGCGLTDRWMYEALLNINERLKKLEEKQ
jgi:hypothetical protein